MAWGCCCGLCFLWAAQPLHCLAFLPNELPLPPLRAGQDQVIKKWDMRTGQMVKSFYGHNDFIRKIKMMPDGRIITCSDDKYAFRPLWACAGVCSAVCARAGVGGSGRCGVDCQSIVSVLTDPCVCGDVSHFRTVRIWDFNTGEILNTFEGHQDYIYDVTCMKNGYVVTASRDGMVMIWDPSKDTLVQKFKAHNNFIYAVTILLDNTIATGSADNTIRIWNPKTGELIKKLEGHKFPVRALQVLEDGNLASCAEDNSVIIWASKKLEVKHTLQGHGKAVWCVAELPNHKFVSGSEDK